MSGMASEVQARAGQQWDKLEGIFEERTAKALKKLGVPSAKDVGALSARIDELAARVGSGPAKAGKTVSRPAAKTAAKRPAKRAV